MSQLKLVKFAPFAIFLLAASFRFYGLNWDQGQHLHPDERFLTMVANTISLPHTVSDYFNTHESQLNPYNYPEYQFFVYGTFPLFLTKLLAVVLHLDNYAGFTVLGRICSALFDLLIVVLLYRLANRLWPKTKIPILAALVYSLMVLPIQLSHFFAVDTFLNLFLVLCFYGLTLWYQKQSTKHFVLSATAFGAAMACKISAIYFAPIIALFILLNFLRSLTTNRQKKWRQLVCSLPLRSLAKGGGLGICFLLLSLFVFRLFQPYAFTGLVTPNPQFLHNLSTLQAFNSTDAWYPPGVQWFNRTPVLFPLKNILIWGLGLPVGLLFLISLAHWVVTLVEVVKHHKFFLSSNLPIFLATFWVILLLLVQGFQHVTTMRYFLPLYPFIALLSAPVLMSVTQHLMSNKNIKNYLLLVACYLLLVTYSFAFINIYTRPHTRNEASAFIYHTVQPGSMVANEHWDDPLPLWLSGANASLYEGPMLELFGPDTEDKWAKLWPQITSRDYLFLSSNRLWASIPRIPERYPVTSKYYQDLFDGKLGFLRLREINSYPGFGMPFLHNCYYFGPTNYPYLTKKNTWFAKDPTCSYPGIYLRDDTAEEAFTVYDHPKVLIFKKK